MADYNSDRTGANIDATLDKVDALDAKVQPIATGANVTGTLVTDGLTVDGIARVDGNITIGRTTGSYVFTEVDGGSERAGIHSNAFNDLNFKVNNSITAMNISGATRDVSFYEDTGTTAKMVWDASAEELQISSNLGVTLGSSDGSGTLPYLGFGSHWDGAKLRAQGSSYFGYALAGDRVGNKVSLQRYDSAGAVSGNITLAGNNVGIGTASPSAKLDVVGDINVSGGVYLGGTGAANKLDDYEEGTWTPTGYTGGSIFASGYTKVGNLVTVNVYFSNGSFDSSTIGGLPFAASTNVYAAASLANSNNTNVDSAFASGTAITFRSGTTSATPDGDKLMISVSYVTSA